MLPDLRQNGMRYDGSLPIGWKIEPAQKACTKITDGTHDTPTPVSTGRPFITAIHVKNGSINFEDCLYLTEADHREIFKRCNAQRGDLAIVNIGAGVGECGFVDVDFEFSMKNVALLKPNPKILDSLFLLHLHQSRKDRIAHVVRSGGAQPFLSLTELKKLPILLPPLPEQRRIAEILSRWDGAIETTQKLIANAQAQKKALMQSLLTAKKRLPGFDGEWKEMTLEKLAKVTMGSSPPSSSYNELGEGLPLIQGNADVKNRVSAPRIHTSLITQKCLPDDIIFSVRAPVGEIAISSHLACIGRGIAAIQARSKDDAEFLYYVLLFAESGWATLSQGSTFQAVNSKDLKGFTFPAPTEVAERQKIGHVIGEAQKAELLLQSQLTAFRQEKSALMQQLLTGKRRVKIEEHRQ